MLRRIIVSVVLAAGIAAASTVARGSAVVEIRNRGRFYSAPATLYLTIAIEPDEDNRLLRVEADGDALYRSSEVVLNGAGSQRLYTMSFRSLPAGTYMLRAAVMSATKVRGVAEEEILVSEGGAR
jgi:hypothetical protein